MTNPNNHDKLCGCNDSDHREMFALVDKFHRPTDKDELRKQYPISTFTGATQDELIEFVLGYADQRVKETVALNRIELAQDIKHRHWANDNLRDAYLDAVIEVGREQLATLKESKDE